MVKFIASPHAHIESPISGSPLKTMIKTAKDLGRTHFTYTDPAYMTSAFTAYSFAKKEGMKFIPGIEVYFKDPNCKFIKGTASERAKYFKITLYAIDQEAYQHLCWLSSRVRSGSVNSYGSSFPLWGWSDLESCKDFNILACNSDIHDLVAKHLLTGKNELILPIVEELIKIFGNNLYFSIIGNKIEKVWENFTRLDYSDGTTDVVYANDKVRTDKWKGGVCAKEIPEKIFLHKEVESFTSRGIYVPVRKKLLRAENISGFIPIPGGDPQLKANKVMVAISKKYNIPLLYSDYSFYASKEDKAVQDIRLSSDEIKEHTLRHMQSSEEALYYMANTLGFSEEEANKVLENNISWASRFDNFNLKYEVSVPAIEEGKDPIKEVMRIIQENGRMNWADPVYKDRLAYEIKVLAMNGTINLLPYFFPIRDVLDYHQKNGVLTGPSRGSAAGVLLLYLLNITQVDPIKYGLSFERFISLDRILTGAFPDVDVDLQHRDLLVGSDGKSGYLYGRWGDRAAQISTRTMMRLKSSIKDVNRYIMGEVEPSIEKLSKSLPPPPQGISDTDFVFGYEDTDGIHHKGLIEVNDDLKAYSEARPKEWDLVLRCLGISRQFSKHASAFVIANDSVSKTVPMFERNLTQYEAKGVEKVGLVKYDFLIVKQLEDIQKCVYLINKKNGNERDAAHFVHDTKEVFVWDLPEDLDVYSSVWGGDTETVFQINTTAMIPFVKKIKPKNIEDLAIILALVRPGPLDYVDPDTGLTMADEYVERRNGNGTVKLPELMELLPETLGIQIYQENTSLVARQIGKMKPTDAEELRRVFSKKDKAKALAMKPLFMEGAIDVVGKDKAEVIWAQMETSSRYSFNKSHAVGYAMITYACMFLKHYYPMEWWAAVLTNATEEEITNKLYKHVRNIVAPPDINLSTNEMVIDYSTKKIRSKISVLKGVGDSASEAIVAGRPYSDIKDFIKKKVAGPSLTKKLILAEVMDSLFPAGLTLTEKIHAFEVANKECEYEEKLAAGKKPRPIDPSKIIIEEHYLGMHPLKEFCEKKAILPTLPYSLYDLIMKHLPHLNVGDTNKPLLSCSRGKPTRFVRGETVQKIDVASVDNDLYFCTPAYILKSEEFSYSKGTKKALKMIVDSDGYICERVLWPDYDTGILKYPEGLEKGKACILFLKRRVAKDQTQIFDIKLLD